MTSLRREVLKSVVPLGIITVITTVVSKKIGGVVEVVGPPVIVIGSATAWGRVVRKKLNRGGSEGRAPE
ncbi:hypothetical protein [Streptomyces sp. NPDC046685]|uniref:hypothetical protein n=1 Tax=Streptomyces sp. NPDC046685 TaxID=3157202 RepID=UPI0033F1A648